MSDEITLAPRSLEEVRSLSKELSVSRLLPAAMQKSPADVMLVVLTGHELGLQPMQAIRGIHIIEGKPSLSADMMSALCLRRRDVCERITLLESTETKATYEAVRVGQKAVKMSWTMEQAKRAGVLGKGNWAKFPEAMLRARCLSAICRAVFPDLVGGVYDPDELLRDGLSAPPAPAAAPAVAEKVVGESVQAPPPPPTPVPEPIQDAEVVDAAPVPIDEKPQGEALTADEAEEIALMEAIQAAQKRAELNPLAARAAKLQSDEAKSRVRKAFMARTKELR